LIITRWMLLLPVEPSYSRVNHKPFPGNRKANSAVVSPGTQSQSVRPRANSINPQTPWNTALALSSRCKASFRPPPGISSFLRPRRSLCHRIFSFFSTLTSVLTCASVIVRRSKVTRPESDMTGVKPKARSKNSAVLACMTCSADQFRESACGIVDGSHKAGARRVRVG
jgi:hypothetical protein